MRKIFVIAIFTFLFFPLSSPAIAQLSDGIVGNTMDGLLINIDTELIDEQKAAIICEKNPASAEKTTIGEKDCSPNAQSKGALRSMGNYLALMMGTKPISSTEYFANLFENIGLPVSQTAYAQYAGIGYDALKPTLAIWKVFRNVAYLLYVIVFVGIGFMIMFRKKIDPQTVISVQSALPRLVITLLLITFSYAIAGLVIDLMYVAIYIPAYLFSAPGNGLFESADKVLNLLFNKSVFGIVMPTGAVDLTEAPSQAITEIIGSLLGAVVEGIGNDLDGSKLVKLILSGMMIFAMFKLFITLGLGFFKIILAVIFAPLQIMLNAVPGSDAFSKWIRGLVSNIAMFPAVAVIFMVSAALMGPLEGGDANVWGVNPEIGYQVNGDDDPGWVPPFILIRGVGGAARSGSTNPAIAILGFFAIMIAPQVATMTRDALKIDKSPYGTGIGESATSSMGMMTAPYRKWKAQGDARKQNDAMGRSIAKNIAGPAANQGP